jgi:hypothetical protein
MSSCGVFARRGNQLNSNPSLSLSWDDWQNHTSWARRAHGTKLSAGGGRLTVVEHDEVSPSHFLCQNVLGCSDKPRATIDHAVKSSQRDVKVTVNEAVGISQ